MADQTVTDKIFASIKQQGFLPIPVQEINPDAGIVRYFGGTFQEFVEAAKSLGAKSLFVETLYLEDEEFYYDSGVEVEEVECHCCKKSDDKDDKEEKPEAEKDAAVWLDPADLDGLDLALLKPELDDYYERVGDECGVRVTVPGPDHLQVEIFTEWYDKFAELVDAASEEIEEDATAAFKKVQAAFAKEQAEE